MILAVRPIKVWPEGWPSRRAGRSSPFRATYADTLRSLDRELYLLGASDPTLQVDVSERDVRLDGQLRADARPNYRGVILAFRTKRFGTLSYPCDTFDGWGTGRPGWQENLRAIALGLEALRKVERYGIAERGQQYAGWRELPSGLAMPAAMSLEEAARFILNNADGYAEDAGWAESVELDPSLALALYKDAARRLHPDTGGSTEAFQRLQDARRLLAEAYPEEG